MKISKQDLELRAHRLLKLLEDEGIDSIEDLEDKVLKNLRVKISLTEEISFILSPSNNNTSAYTISYGVDNVGTPLEIKMNSALNYTKIILKSIHHFRGYSPFHMDLYNNIMQQITIPHTNLSKIKEKIVSL